MDNGIVFLDPPSVSGKMFSSQGAVIPPGSRIIETGALHGIIDGEPPPESRSTDGTATPRERLIVQSRRALERVRIVLAEGGATLSDIFQIRVFLAAGQDRRESREALDTVLNSGDPAKTLLMTVVEVVALTVPEALVAIEARAALPVDGMNESAREMWIEYLQANPSLIAEGVCTGVSAWSFGAGKEMADELAELVVAGTKRATASSMAGLLMEREPIPHTGLYSVILDGSARARGIIRTAGVAVGPLSHVTATFARREGEGDGSREYWLDEHRRYFAAEHRRLGLPFSDEIPVVYEEFDLVWPRH